MTDSTIISLDDEKPHQADYFSEGYWAQSNSRQAVDQI